MANKNPKPRQKGNITSTTGMVKGERFKHKGPPKPFPKGNDFWNRRSTQGADKIFATPAIMWQAAVEYFQYNLSSPIQEEKLLVVDKRVIRKKVDHPRAMTLEGLCLFLGVTASYFRTFKHRLKVGEIENPEGFATIIDQIEHTIRTQKFEYASVGLMNATIISRDLGLIDKQAVEVQDMREDVGEMFPFEDDKAEVEKKKAKDKQKKA